MAIEKLAKCGNPDALPFPIPMKRSRTKSKTCDFSFAGLKTSVRLYMENIQAQEALDMKDQKMKEVKADVAASFQQTVIKHLRDRTERALHWAQEMEPKLSCLLVSGGVASNHSVRTSLKEVADEAGIAFICPPAELCTDNGVMVAWTGQERLAAGLAEEPPPLTEVYAAERNPKEVRFHLRPRWPIGDVDERSAHGRVRSQSTLRRHDSLTGSPS